MLFSADAWPGIADGSITVTFRTWQRPQAKTGNRYRVGGMSIEAIDVALVPIETITDDDARRAGAADRAALLRRLKIDAPTPHPITGPTDDSPTVWRVEFRHLGQDDRIERRQQVEVTDDQLAAIRARLDRLDRASGGGPWTRATLRLIERYPGVVSTALARHTGQERPAFKLNVRKLKELGLTESLDVGYRLSPLGEVVLRAL